MRKVLIVWLVFISACSSRRMASVPPSEATGISIQGKLFATFFQQRAAEYRALCFQAFNIARLRLDQYKPETNKPLAIITDIDETILDNSAYDARQTLQGKDYDPATWLEWTSKSIADTVPGAAQFLKYASSKGVEIFYITNREEIERSSTILNLRKFGLPNTDDQHFLPKLKISGKEPRRISVASTHEIVLLMGDNLADFSDLFDKKPMDERNSITDLISSEFGNRFILLPNTVYGDWESSLFRYNYNLTQPQKDSLIRSALKTY